MKKPDETDSSDTDSEEYTVITTVGGGTTVIPGDSKFQGAYLNIPGLSRLNIGSNNVTVIGRTQERSTKRKHRTQDHHTHKAQSKERWTESPKKTSPSQPLSEQDMNHVCNNIGRRWKKLAYALDLSRGSVEAIEIDYHIEGVYEMTWQTLLSWKRRKGGMASVRDLVQALDDIGMDKLAYELPIE